MDGEMEEARVEREGCKEQSDAERGVVGEKRGDRGGKCPYKCIFASLVVFDWGGMGFGQHPMLDTPDGPIFESNAICRYIARGTSLYPSPPAGPHLSLAQIDAWIDSSISKR